MPGCSRELPFQRICKISGETKIEITSHNHGSVENGCISNLSFLSCRVIFALNHDYLGERVSNKGFVFSGTFWLSTALFLMLLSFRFHSAKRLREDPPSHLKPIKHRSPLISAVKSSQAFSPSQDKLFTPHARGGNFWYQVFTLLGNISRATSF